MKYLTYVVRFGGLCALYSLGELWFQDIYPSKIEISLLLVFIAWWMLVVKLNIHDNRDYSKKDTTKIDKLKGMLSK